MKNSFVCHLKMFLVSVSFSVCLMGCGNSAENVTDSVGTEVVEEEPINNSLDDAKEAYSLLISSADTVNAVGQGLVGAWGYSIDRSGNGTISGLADACGLTSDEVQATYDLYMEDLSIEDSLKDWYKPSMWIDDFSTVLDGLISCGYAPYIETVEGDLATAKSLIQSVNQSESYYSDLVNYYTAISNYLEFCKSPTGNYELSGTTINDYIKEMRTAKTKLSFYLE